MAVLWNSMIEQKTVIDGLILDRTGTIPLDGEGLALSRRLSGLYGDGPPPGYDPPKEVELRCRLL